MTTLYDVLFMSQIFCFPILEPGLSQTVFNSLLSLSDYAFHTYVFGIELSMRQEECSLCVYFLCAMSLRRKLESSQAVSSHNSQRSYYFYWYTFGFMLLRNCQTGTRHWLSHSPRITGCDMTTLSDP